MLADRSRTWNCSIGPAMHDPGAFRSTLLIAGLHYSWNAGGLLAFDSTYRFHMGASLRTVNRWLDDKNTRKTARCVRLIATLSFTEVRRQRSPPSLSPPFTMPSRCRPRRFRCPLEQRGSSPQCCDVTIMLTIGCLRPAVLLR